VVGHPTNQWANEPSWTFNPTWLASHLFKSDDHKAMMVAIARQMFTSPALAGADFMPIWRSNVSEFNPCF
jgi:hypothetical protein